MYEQQQIDAVAQSMFRFLLFPCLALCLVRVAGFPRQALSRRRVLVVRRGRERVGVGGGGKRSEREWQWEHHAKRGKRRAGGRPLELVVSAGDFSAGWFTGYFCWFVFHFFFPFRLLALLTFLFRGCFFYRVG